MVPSLRPITSAISHAGVDLFFVISGAIVFIVSQRPRGKNRFAETGEILFRRAMRMFPLYWMSMIVFMALWPQSAPDPMTLLSYVLLIGIPPEHPVAWTLIYEARFYLMIAVVILLFRHVRANSGPAGCWR